MAASLHPAVQWFHAKEPMATGDTQEEYISDRVEGTHPSGKSRWALKIHAQRRGISDNIHDLSMPKVRVFYE